MAPGLSARPACDRSKILPCCAFAFYTFRDQRLDQCEYEEEEYEDRHFYKNDKGEDKSSDDESGDEEIASGGRFDEAYNKMTEGALDIGSEYKDLYIDPEEEEEVKMEMTQAVAPNRLLSSSAARCAGAAG